MEVKIIRSVSTAQHDLLSPGDIVRCDDRLADELLHVHQAAELLPVAGQSADGGEQKPEVV
mgnify:FL=1